MERDSSTNYLIRNLIDGYNRQTTSKYKYYETVVKVPKQEELIQERDEIIEKKNQQGNIEVTMDDEGGAEIAFDPRVAAQEGGQDHFENLAEFLGGRTEPFRGASGVNHPVLAEAVTQFQAQAYKELLPSDGPVRTQIMGDVNVQKEEQAKRVKDFMNYQIMDQMKEYEPEFDQMLLPPSLRLYL